MNRLGILRITNFSNSNLKSSAYTLNPGHVVQIDQKGKRKTIFNFFDDKEESYIIDPHTYHIIETHQSIEIKEDGIFGNFITTSDNVKFGLILSAGQIDSLFGRSGEKLWFGVFNASANSVAINASHRLAHLQIVDMRGCSVDPDEEMANRLKSPPMQMQVRAEESFERRMPNYENADDD